MFSQFPVCKKTNPAFLELLIWRPPAPATWLGASGARGPKWGMLPPPSRAPSSSGRECRAAFPWSLGTESPAAGVRAAARPSLGRRPLTCAFTRPEARLEQQGPRAAPGPGSGGGSGWPSSPQLRAGAAVRRCSRVPWGRAVGTGTVAADGRSGLRVARGSDSWAFPRERTQRSLLPFSPAFQGPHQSAQVVRGQDNGGGAAGAHPGSAEGTRRPAGWWPSGWLPLVGDGGVGGSARP